MRNSFLVKSRPPGLRCLPHDSQSLQTRQFIKPTRPASLTDPIRAGLHRKYEDPFSALRTIPKDNPAVWDYYGSVRKLDPQLGVIGPLRKQDHVLKDSETAKSRVDQKSDSDAGPLTDPEHEVWRRSIEPLLALHGGRWTITEDGTGLERYFNFKTFAKAWNFMSAIVPECKANRHHPEWSNTFRTVFIRWRTHEPDNHISLLDIKLARICDEQAKAFGEVIPEAETNTKSEEKTVTPLASSIADTTIASAPSASSTAVTVDVSKVAATSELAPTTADITTTNNQSHKAQPGVLVEATDQTPSEPSKAVTGIPGQADQLPQRATKSAVQGVAEPMGERSPSEAAGEHRENCKRQPEEEKEEETRSEPLPLEEVLKQDEKCLEETVARIRKKDCTLEEVQETARKLAELAARHQSGEYRFTRELSQERVKIEKEISDRLKFFRRANHEWRQAKKMERRLERDRQEREHQLQSRPPLLQGRSGAGDPGKPPPLEAEPAQGERRLSQPRERRILETQPKKEAQNLAPKEEKPPDRAGLFQSIFRQP
ncbi:hypothetical protein QBC36DRAFT_345 [Triangularia setosa]|uniref:4a-hydroxytetrahydrobiopterin dehydratase n=1 Tax=Triangularia setosa TaxID=2587417 RepID=A0AAN6WHF4_9PEZI|nr:hypothetical protein QBC36DRAFT_345 [Podospora setosa]